MHYMENTPAKGPISDQLTGITDEMGCSKKEAHNLSTTAPRLVPSRECSGTFSHTMAPEVVVQHHPAPSSTILHHPDSPPSAIEISFTSQKAPAGHFLEHYCHHYGDHGHMAAVYLNIESARMKSSLHKTWPLRHSAGIKHHPDLEDNYEGHGKECTKHLSCGVG